MPTTHSEAEIYLVNPSSFLARPLIAVARLSIALARNPLSGVFVGCKPLRAVGSPLSGLSGRGSQWGQRCPHFFHLVRVAKLDGIFMPAIHRLRLTGIWRVNL